MALTQEQWATVNEAMSTLRSLGCAVQVFTPDDVETCDDTNVSPDQAVSWLHDNRKRIEDGMAVSGNRYIADNLSQDIEA